MANPIVRIPRKATVQTMLCFYFFIFCFLPTTFCAEYLQKLPVPVPGPSDLEFDSLGKGPYISVADGRILKYQGRPKLGFVEYGYSKADRPRRFCEGTNNTFNAKICGRPLGLGFYYQTGELYAADAGIGLVVIRPRGGPGKLLASSAEKLPFKFLNGIEVDKKTGVVYMTDASSRLNLSQIAEIVSTRDTTGTLLTYDPRTKRVTVLLRGLGGSSGVAMSKDGSYLLVVEFVNARVLKYCLKGPRANTSQVLVNINGIPLKIRRNAAGDFWIAVNVVNQDPTQTPILQGQRINGNGDILETITFSPALNESILTEVLQYKHDLYLGSLFSEYLGIYRRS